jgi:precorrin-2 dehydrogenase/sirohydrochlorin ferrochelatase
VQLFPVFLDLARRPCLVVGGGAVGRHKAAALAAAGATVLVVDPSPPASLLSLAGTEPAVTVEAREFRDGDCAGRILVFACTENEGVNAAVAAAAAAHGALCCRADGGGDFSTGALLRRGEFCVAVSSGGSSPGLAVHARDRIAVVVGDEFGVAARLLRALRERLRGRVPEASARASALRSVQVADLLEALRAGDEGAARTLVDGAYEAGCRAPGETPRAAEGNRCTR